MSQRMERSKQIWTGVGQLSLVEHSLCPLDRQSSLTENFVHRTEYRYSDSKRKRQTARVNVICPLGLSATDEFYLWGLLALTLSQADDRADLVATPQWCLKQLGAIDSRSGRGGEQYRLFRDALRRLSVVSYLCNAFYDPVRQGHRDVSFHFFSYTLPRDPSSNRAWRLNWDQTFLDLVKHGASHLRFDLDLYRRLDPASRRLFLFVSKIFHRREVLPQFDLQHLAVDVLGFSSSVAPRDLRIKLQRCLSRLETRGVVRDPKIVRVGKNRYVVNAIRGPHFDRRSGRDSHRRNLEPVLATLISVGFDTKSAASLIRRFPIRLLEEWADITLAKIDQQGRGSFRKSPMAYLVDSVSKAKNGTRTPPDWWHELQRAERQKTELTDESRKVLNRIQLKLVSSSDEQSVPAASPGVSRAGEILKTIG